MTAATAALVVLGLAFTALAGPLTDVTDRAAGELRDRAVYVGAVAPGTVVRTADGGVAVGPPARLPGGFSERPTETGDRFEDSRADGPGGTPPRGADRPSAPAPEEGP
jgi:multicomponent Na+:H+ antiporter subunit D